MNTEPTTVLEERLQEDPLFGRHHWDAVAAATLHATPARAWRSYMRRVYLRLLKEWFAEETANYVLKTDLFEEAVTPHYLLADVGPLRIGIDASAVVVRAARERLLKQGFECLFIIGDLRQLPLRPGSVRQILSGSSLDHFPEKADIARSLRQLAQTLPFGGTLVITFDNPHNPVVWVRNHLPFAWLNRLGLVPYYVGATYTQEEARRQIEAAGLTLTDMTVVAHAPRALMIGLVALSERFGWGWLEALVAGFLNRCEALALWPTRFVTGYYLAFRAEKRAAPTQPSAGL